MLHPSTKRLIDKLNDMTRKQRVAWTESDDGSVTHDTEGYRVILTPEPHAIFLTDALGRQIETCTPDEFADETDANGRPYAKFVAELYREAHRHARGTEKAIRALLQTLDAADVDQQPAATAETSFPQTTADVNDAIEDLVDETAPIEGEQAITDAVASLAEQVNNAIPAQVAAIAPVVEPVETSPAGQPEPAAPVTEIVEGVLAAEREGSDIAVAPEAEPDARAETPAPGLAYAGGFFGAYGGIGQYTGPASEPPVTPQAEQAEPQQAPPEAMPAPEPRSAPVIGQRISLSSIPYGFGLGAVSPPVAPETPPAAAVTRSPADEHQSPATPEPPLRLIDGTVDLPDPVGDTGAGWVVRDTPVDDRDADLPFPSPSLDDQRDVIEPDPESPAPGPSGNPSRRFNPWN